MNIIFFGSDPWFSPPVLKALLAAGIEVPAVVTKGDALTKNKKQKTKNKIFYLQAKTAEDISRERLENLLRSDLPRSDLGRSDLLAPDAIVLASFGPPFLAAEVLKWPKYGCLNVHASLLPRWRGAYPVFASLREGDKETGVSIMRMTEEIDRGPVLGQRKIKVKQPILPSSRATPTLCRGSRETQRSDLNRSLRSLDPSASLGMTVDTRETLTKKLGKLGGELIVETLKKLETGQITEMPQPEKSPTPYTRRLTKQAGRIDWSQSPIEIERFIRAAFPWPSTMSNVKFKIKNEKWQTIQNVKILKAHVERVRDFRGVSPVHENHEIKRKTRNRNEVKLVIDQVQLPGKTPITWKQFLAGHPEVKFE